MLSTRRCKMKLTEMVLILLLIVILLSFFNAVTAEIEVDTVYSPGGTQTCWAYPDGKVVCF